MIRVCCVPFQISIFPTSEPLIFGVLKRVFNVEYFDEDDITPHQFITVIAPDSYMRCKQDI